MNTKRVEAELNTGTIHLFFQSSLSSTKAWLAASNFENLRVSEQSRANACFAPTSPSNKVFYFMYFFLRLNICSNTEKQLGRLCVIAPPSDFLQEPPAVPALVLEN